MILADRGAYALSCALLLILDATLGQGGKGQAGSSVKSEVKINAEDGAEMVWVPGGEFLMGADHSDNLRSFWKFCRSERVIDRYAKSEAPKHRVRLDGFWMYKHEVTVRQFQKFVEATDYETEAEKEGGGRHYDLDTERYVWIDGLSWRRPFQKDMPAIPDHPVVLVSWNDAQAYCRWAGVRLSTEAEWEYAARGGNTGLAGKPWLTFVWGDDIPWEPVANMWDEAAARKHPSTSFLKFPDYDDGYELTAPVGTYPPNAFGLFDMAGNVYEWCSDWHGEDYYWQSPPQSPQGPARGKYRVLRGGSWARGPFYLHLTYRGGDQPHCSSTNYGFRCAKTPSPLPTLREDDLPKEAGLSPASAVQDER